MSVEKPWPPHDFTPGSFFTRSCVKCGRLADHENHNTEKEEKLVANFIVVGADEYVTGKYELVEELENDTFLVVKPK